MSFDRQDLDTEIAAAMNALRQPVAATTHHQPVVSSEHHQPVAATTHHQPVVSSEHHQPVVSTIHHQPVSARSAAVLASSAPSTSASAPADTW